MRSAVVQFLERLSTLPSTHLFSLDEMSQKEKSTSFGIRHTCACKLAVAL